MQGRYHALKDYICYLIDLDSNQPLQPEKVETKVETSKKEEDDFAPLSPEEMKKLLSRGRPLTREEAECGKPLSEYNIWRYQKGLL